MIRLIRLFFIPILSFLCPNLSFRGGVKRFYNNLFGYFVDKLFGLVYKLFKLRKILPIFSRSHSIGLFEEPIEGGKVPDAAFDGNGLH